MVLPRRPEEIRSQWEGLLAPYLRTVKRYMAWS
jgi:hypothetical protein